MASVIDKCQWNLECVANTIAAALMHVARGEAPYELVRESAFKDEAECKDNTCILSISDISFINELDDESLKLGVERFLKYMPLDELPDLITLLLELGFDRVLQAFNRVIPFDLEGHMGARINEVLGIAMYSIAEYTTAMDRFNAASVIYEKVGERGRARFMEGMSKVAHAERLRVEASRSHDEGKHDVEERLIKEASRLYASSAISFREAVDVVEARANEVLSMMDSYEVLANYYFIHGDLSRASSYYEACANILGSARDLSGEYYHAVRIKGNICGAFYVLCKAMEEGDWRLYEEAGDRFLGLIEEGLIDEITAEGAVMAYRGALDYVEDIEDAVRIYTKYAKAIVRYFDTRISELYGDFKSFVREVKSGNADRIARELGTDENTLKLYIVGKLLRDVCEERGIKEDFVYETLSYLGGLGLNPLEAEIDEVLNEIKNITQNEELIARLGELLGKVKERYESY